MPSMRMQDVLEVVQEKLRTLQAVQGMKVLEQSETDVLIEHEKQAEESSKESGFVRVVNEGFWSTFRREHQIALVLKEGMEIKPRINDLLQLRNAEGKKVGEWIGKGKGQRRAGVSRLTMGDFMLYEGAKLSGEPYFVVPEIEFPFLRGVKGIQNVVSCSPAAMVDDQIRDWLGLKQDGLFTRIAGFDIDRDDIK